MIRPCRAEDLDAVLTIRESASEAVDEATGMRLLRLTTSGRT